MPGRVTLLLVCALLAGSMTSCASIRSSTVPSDDTPTTPPPLSVVRGTQYTDTFELVVNGMHVGYVTEYLPVPMGTMDSRPLREGALRIEDLDFRWLGFIDPSGFAYRFDDRDELQPISLQGRDAQILAIRGVVGTTVVLRPTFAGS